MSHPALSPRRYVAMSLFLSLVASLSFAQAPRTLWDFPQSKSGLGSPIGPLVADKAGHLYGLAEAPGAGTIYRLSPPRANGGQWKPEVLYSFQCQSDGCLGFFSSGSGDLILDAKGNLYGTTSGIGGNPCQKTWCGSVFELSPPASSGGAWTLTNLHTFTGPDGLNPNPGLVMDKNGNLYGSTPFDSASAPLNGGTVFQLSPPSSSGGSWTFSTLYTFSYPDGPQSGLVMDMSGNFYGVSTYSGPANCSVNINPVGCGRIFQLVKPSSSGGSWTVNNLYQFTGGSDGAFPPGKLTLDENGNLFSITTRGGDPSCIDGKGGTGGCGVAFEISPASGGSWTYSVIHTFGGNETSIIPFTRLWRDNLGNLYGSSSDTNSAGDIYKLSPPLGGVGDWGLSILGSFDSGLQPDGVIYLKRTGLVGARWAGGPAAGQVFAVTP